MCKCIKCKNTVTGEYFDGVSGKLCKACLKDLFVYHALRSMNLIKNVKEN